MGRVEKVVVLAVLFVVCLIVAVSIYPKGPAPREELAGVPSAVRSLEEPSVPLERPTSRTSAPSEETAPAVEPQASPVPGLLSSSVEVPAAQHVLRGVPERLAPDWDLVTLEGLRATVHEDVLVYTCRTGDTFEGLARELYGDAELAGLLQRNNEGLRALRPGLEILVPVRDDRGDDSREHVVQEGESLWILSKRFYGDGTRWQELFEANRDLLSAPDAVRAGMRLRIP